jgi:hypothetical protein
VRGISLRKQRHEHRIQLLSAAIDMFLDPKLLYHANSGTHGRPDLTVRSERSTRIFPLARASDFEARQLALSLPLPVLLQRWPGKRLVLPMDHALGRSRCELGRSVWKELSRSLVAGLVL